MQRGLGLMLILVWVIAILIMLFMLKKSGDDKTTQDEALNDLPIEEKVNNGENWFLDI